jgi:hypothetical protein
MLQKLGIFPSYSHSNFNNLNKSKFSIIKMQKNNDKNFEEFNPYLNNNSRNLILKKNIKNTRSKTANNKNINNSNFSYSNTNYNNSLCDSLYCENKKRKDKYLNYIELKEKLFNDTYSFNPKINNNSLSEHYLKSYYSHYNKKLKYSKSKQNIRNNENINDNFNKIKHSKLKKNKISLKLISKNYKLKKKELLDNIKMKINEEQKITFKPKLNDKINNKLVNTSFYDRNLRIKINNNNNNSNIENNYSFIPKINTNYLIE